MQQHQLNIARLLLLFMILFCFHTPSNGQEQTKKQTSIEAIRTVEKQFETDLNKFGAAFAFEKYAAEEAVIKRNNDSIIKGPTAIKTYYSSSNYNNAKATWAPDFIDLSSDGTMAYTYGKYQWTFVDSTGKKVQYQGVFHTVWKKQQNGSWKYVWD